MEFRLLHYAGEVTYCTKGEWLCGVGPRHAAPIESPEETPCTQQSHLEGPSSFLIYYFYI
jgi:hypothetical protein